MTSDEDPKSAAGAGKATTADEEDERAAIKKRSKRPLVVLMLVVLLGAGVAAALLLQDKPNPRRVLVAVELNGQWWQGSKLARALSFRLAHELDRLGFEAVPSCPTTLTNPPDSSWA